jgi:uncharacterized membrane protein
MMSWAVGFQLRQHFRQSLWAVPLLGAVAGGALAGVDLRVEDQVRLPREWSYSAATASSLLTTVSGAMIGLLGLVVTVGVLVVQMATGTLSPRFMRLWYRDRLQKAALAAFTATFAFSFVCSAESKRGRCRTSGSPWPASLSAPTWCCCCCTWTASCTRCDRWRLRPR